MPYFKYRIVALVLFGVSHLLVGQEKSCTVTFTVVDSVTQAPLPNAIASFQTISQSGMTWTYTDAQGQASYLLMPGDTVQSSFSYLGYAEKEVVLHCEEPTTVEHIILLAAQDLPLREVVITDQLPAILEKKDSTIYNVDSFATGRERKLKQILQGLPGVEVDQRNQVYVKGQKVQEVLLEGETFFTGDAALAVKNVPADVVDRIEVLEKYNEIIMLRGQDSGDRLVLNVRLKQNEKKFLFGEIKGATNVTDRHRLQPGLFYYSPKLRVNGVGEYTTTEQTALTPGEVMRFMGIQLNQYDPAHQSTLVQQISLIRNYIPSSAFFEQESWLGVLQGQYRFANNVFLDVIGLGVQNEQQVRRKTVRTFLDAGTGTEESNRHVTTGNDRTFLRGKINSDPNKDYFLSYEWQYSDLPVLQSDSAFTIFLEQPNQIAQATDRAQRDHRHEARWIQQWHDQWQSIVHLRYGDRRQGQDDTWQFGERPVSVADTLANTLQQIQSNRTDQFYSLVRVNYRLAKQSRAFAYVRWDQQAHDPAARVHIDGKDGMQQGYGYPATTFQSDQWVSGARYLWQQENWNIKLGLDYVQARWGKGPTTTDRWSTKGTLAPSLQLGKIFSGIGKINLDYSYSLVTPNYMEGVPGLLFQQFNQLQTGTPHLQAGQTQQISLSLSRSRLLAGKTFSGLLHFRHVASPILQHLELRGSSLVWVTQNSTKPLQDYGLMLNWMQVRRAFKVVSVFNVRYSRFQQSINGVPVPVKRFSASNNLRISYTKQRQEASLNWRMSLQNTPQNAGQTKWFVNNNLLGGYRIFWSNRWQSGLQADYQVSWAEALSQGAFLLHGDLKYTTKDERCAFGLRIYNLFNQRWIGSNQVTALGNTSMNRRLMSRYAQAEASYLF